MYNASYAGEMAAFSGARVWGCRQGAPECTVSTCTLPACTDREDSAALCGDVRILAADGGAAYVLHEGNLKRCVRSGACSVIGASGASVAAIADGNSVYWDDGGLKRAGAPNWSAASVAGGPEQVQDVLIDGAYLWVLTATALHKVKR